jgi:hypothetical protein
MDGCSDRKRPVVHWDEPDAPRQRLPGLSSRARLGLSALTLGLVSAFVIGLRVVAPPPTPGPVESRGPHGSSAIAVATSAAAPRQPVTSAQSEMTHLDNWGLSFDYPARWTVEKPSSNMPYISVLAFLGTGTGHQECNPVGPTFQCYSNIHLEPDQVVVKLSETAVQIGGPFDPAGARWLSPGQGLTTVGGLPATLSQTAYVGWYQSDLALVWKLSAPGTILERYEIDAYIRGPDTDVLRTEVERLVASIRYDPAPQQLDPTAGPDVASGTLASLRTADPNGFCYPAQPGLATETVESVFGVQLTKPLPVACDVQIEPLVGLWKLTIIMTWEAAPDRSAGTYTLRLFLAPDGKRTWSDAVGDAFPYWPNG